MMPLKVSSMMRWHAVLSLVWSEDLKIVSRRNAAAIIMLCVNTYHLKRVLIPKL